MARERYWTARREAYQAVEEKDDLASGRDDDWVPSSRSTFKFGWRVVGVDLLWLLIMGFIYLVLFPIVSYILHIAQH